MPGEQLARYPVTGDSVVLERPRRLLVTKEHVYILDRMARRVHQYERGGRYVRSVGSRGSGPGEFRELDWVQASRDGHLSIVDTRTRRLTVFGPRGQLIRADPLNSLFRSFALLPDGRFAVPRLDALPGVDTLEAPFPHRQAPADREGFQRFVQRLLHTLVLRGQELWVVDEYTGRVWRARERVGEETPAPDAELPDWVAIRVRRVRERSQRMLGRGYVPALLGAHVTPSGRLWLRPNPSSVIGLLPALTGRGEPIAVLYGSSAAEGINDAVLAGDTLIALYDTEVREYTLVPWIPQPEED